MAPFTYSHATDGLLALLLGVMFGFVLERAGFGNARKLAAQFYLHEMRVLKVMFTAIVTAMVLLHLASALGWLDFSRLAVPPTYLGPAVAGGLLLGVGFIVGGYCPGTSLVSMATLKLDGLAFVVGVMAGLWAFAESVPWYWDFFQHSAALGRLTLGDWLGVDSGLLALGVVVMALGAFWGAEQVEALFATPAAPVQPLTPHARRLRRLGAGLALLLAMVTAVVGQPSPARRMAWNAEVLDRRLSSRAYHVDPAELLALMHNNQTRLVLLDVRPEEEFNTFHLLDATHTGLSELETMGSLPEKAVMVLMSNDERLADEAWRRLALRPGVNAYVLAGGVNRWLDLYGPTPIAVPDASQPARGDDRLRHRFARAVGDRDPASRPARQGLTVRPYTAKVKSLVPVRLPGGGCG
jgi:rhodanese-related sulfurtransferase